MAEQSSETYEVEKIIEHRLLSDGNPEYLVKWVGYPEDESTWEPLSSLCLAEEAIRLYTDQFNAEKAIRIKNEVQVPNKKGKKGGKTMKGKKEKAPEPNLAVEPAPETAPEPAPETSKSKKSACKRKAEKPVDDDDIEEDYMALLEELKSDELLIKNELSRIAANPLGRGMCIFCGGHFASELCTLYPTHKARMRLVERELRCKACGSKEHRMKKFPPCNPTWCLFCQKEGHIQHMCKIFEEGVIDPYVH